MSTTNANKTKNANTKASAENQTKTADHAENSTPEADVFSFAKLGMSEFFKPDFSQFDMSKLELPAAFRVMSEKVLEQSRDGYSKAKSAAEDAMNVMEDTLEGVRQGSLELQLKSIDYAKANTDAIYDFFKDMAQVKSLSEAIEVQTAFARQQFDTLSAQSKDIQELATQVADETAKPSKQVFEKTFKSN